MWYEGFFLKSSIVGPAKSRINRVISRLSAGWPMGGCCARFYTFHYEAGRMFLTRAVRNWSIRMVAVRLNECGFTKGSGEASMAARGSDERQLIQIQIFEIRRGTRQWR